VIRFKSVPFKDSQFVIALILASACGGGSLLAQDCSCCQPSWIFRRSQYSHDPATGARVAQYDRIPPVEPLPDPRLVTSGYRRVRSNLRGIDGSIDSAYSVSSYGNGRGGLDAEWERFHDAWLQSYTAGGTFNYQQAPFAPYGGFPYGGHPYGGTYPYGAAPYGGNPYGGFTPGPGLP
jgi:hypothetical protein